MFDFLSGPDYKNNHLWFMAALLFIYVFMPLIKIAYDTNKKVFCYFIIIVAILTFGARIIRIIYTIIFGLAYGMPAPFPQNWMNTFNPFTYIYGYSFVYFCIGGISFSLIEKIKSFNAVKRNIIAISLLLLNNACLFITGILMSHVTNNFYDTGWNGHDMVFTLINVSCVFILSLSWQKSFKIVEIVSKNSLGIYIIHRMLIDLTLPLVIKLPFINNLVSIIFYAGLIMLAGLIITLLIKKIPVLKKLVQWG